MPEQVPLRDQRERADAAIDLRIRNDRAGTERALALWDV